VPREVLGAVNERLDEAGAPARVRVVRRMVLRVPVTETELKTVHVEKDRIALYRRIA
jgi:hypothetical protein